MPAYECGADITSMATLKSNGNGLFLLTKLLSFCIWYYIVSVLYSLELSSYPITVSSGKPVVDNSDCSYTTFIYFFNFIIIKL